jgi:hypothetical protein
VAESRAMQAVAHGGRSSGGAVSMLGFGLSGAATVLQPYKVWRGGCDGGSAVGDEMAMWLDGAARATGGRRTESEGQRLGHGGGR